MMYIKPSCFCYYESKISSSHVQILRSSRAMAKRVTKNLTTTAQPLRNIEVFPALLDSGSMGPGGFIDSRPVE